MTPLILGLAGPVLSDEERAFFADVDPAGFILFRRNIEDAAQLRALTDALRAVSGRADVPILIDQEGGRVARMQPPVWPAFPRAEVFDRLYDVAPASAIEAAKANAQAIATMLHEAGINVNCLPLLDVRQPDAHDIIGDRALGAEPLRVAALGRAVLEGMQAAGVVGVVKHIPGHGRAMADSHVELPVVTAPAEELESDLAPFIALNGAPMGMTAHVVYTAWDAQECASLSARVIGDVIRGRIGFDGLLMSDDLGMHALSGDFGERAAGVLAAGCDIALHCSGDMAEMRAVAGAVGAIADDARARLDRAMATVAGRGPDIAFADLVAKRDALLAYA
ncbi:beta-N-acetylhexosaminidase [Edaphosphingomonas haloaromaticamans]|uniref:beta-N-acetylhexosaminidase n=1 Tax=Edaphosphingomonas haloaromaticamans TaxID=653954 RepID=A0A1S1HHE5_9SPHN|nr:beta-N-acetylhexosaminidase [Sphingomonas haloaromaticamans]OHT21252.1 Beta-hexosaminidase [Sphingomonas haloaromaticamans]